MSAHYGGFLGGDPRRFTPDEECCTPAEIAAWQAACAAWNRGQLVEVDGHVCRYDEHGALVMHIARNPFGIGVTMLDDEDDEPEWDDDGDDDSGPDEPSDDGDDEAQAEHELTEVTASWLHTNLDQP